MISVHSERWASTLFLSFLVEMASVFVPDLSLGHFFGPSPNLQQATQSCPPAAWPVWLPGLSGCPASGSSWCEALGMEPVPPPFAAPPFSQSLPCLERARPASFRSFLDSPPLLPSKPRFGVTSLFPMWLKEGWEGSLVSHRMVWNTKAT